MNEENREIFLKRKLRRKKSEKKKGENHQIIIIKLQDVEKKKGR
jgi:hypothetical protein